MANFFPGKGIHDCDRYRYSVAVLQLLRGYLLYSWTAGKLLDINLLVVAKEGHEYSKTGELKIAVSSLVQRASGGCPHSVMRSDLALLFWLHIHYYARVDTEGQLRRFTSRALISYIT